MAAAENVPWISDGSCDFSQGVDSLKSPTAQSPDNPNGLARNQLAWLVNSTVRDGSISPRDGWIYRGTVVSLSSLPYLLGAAFQGKSNFIPASGNPYEIWVVGGHVLKVDPTGVIPPVDLSEVYGFTFPAPLAPKVYFVQAISWLVIQAGDYNPQTGNGSLPLFWDGSTLTQSNGLTGITSVGTPIPNSYTLTSVRAWTVPTVVAYPFGAGAGVQIYTATQYGGNLGDKVQIFAGPTSATFGAFGKIGDFVVIGIQANVMTVQTVASGFVGTAALVADGPFTFDLEIPTTSASQAVNVIAGLPVETSTGTVQEAGVPQDGGIAILKFSGNYLYPGMVGDSVQMYWGAGNLLLGTLLVLGISAGVMDIQTQSTSQAGHQFTGTIKILPINNASHNASYFLIPPMGQTATIPIDHQYIGSLGDTISIPGAGTFLVTNVGNFLEQGPLVIRAIQPINVGHVFPTTFTLTVTIAPSSVGTLINQIPAATAMAFYVGRIFYAQGTTVNYGDVVGSLSGTAANDFLDSVLSVTQNPFILGGGGFTMPSGNDNITGMAIPQMINASLGQGLLNIGTANGVFALQVPTSQAQWNSLTATNPPQIFVVQQSNGFTNDWCVVSINGDLWFQSFAADIRSLLTAVRYFQQWGNVSLSSNEDRILAKVNQLLLGLASGVYYNNRLLMTTYPQQTPFGVVHPALIPLDLTTISTLEQQDPPNWEGQYEGLQIFQLATGTYGNTTRAFASVLSTTNSGQMETWELMTGQIGDQSATGNNRIQWQAETCSFTWNELFKLKELLSAELWIDEIKGVLDVEVEYKPDGSSCWFPWAAFSVCSATDSSQLTPPSVYPLITFQPGTRKPLVLPKPPQACAGENSRPSNIFYEAQVRLTLLGAGRVRGFRLHGQFVKRPLYQSLITTLSSWAKSIFTSILGG